MQRGKERKDKDRSSRWKCPSVLIPRLQLDCHDPPSRGQNNSMCKSNQLCTELLSREGNITACLYPVCFLFSAPETCQGGERIAWTHCRTHVRHEKMLTVALCLILHRCTFIHLHVCLRSDPCTPPDWITHTQLQCKLSAHPRTRAQTGTSRHAASAHLSRPRIAERSLVSSGARS